MFYYQHHIGDFIKATSRLTDSQTVGYLRLLWMYYDSEKPLQNDIEVLAMQIGLPVTDTHLLLRAFFKLENNVWIQARCDAEIADYHEHIAKKSNAGKASAERRKNKSATVVEQVLDECSTDEQLTTNHKPITNNHKPKREKATDVACPPDVGLQEWTDWLALRKAKKAPVTETVVKSARKEAEKAGISLNAFLTIWCARGSQGLQADWLKSAERITFAQQAADIARTTVPAKQGTDPALLKIEQDRQKAVPMPANIREQINSVLRKA